MKTNKPKILAFAALALLAVSCSKDVENVIADEVETDAGSGTLTVRTRAGETTDASEISYPVNVYVFDSDSKCAGFTTIESESGEVQLELEAGEYSVYAIAGANADSYDLPTAETASAESVISLKDGQKHGDIMTFTGNVTLTKGGDNTLTLSMVRKVMMIESVSVSGIPSEATAVSATISPIYSGILLNGSYTGAGSSVTVELTQGTTAGVWENAESVYTMAASSTPSTITINITIDGKVQSYSYSCADELSANHKVSISGTYIEDTGVTLTGTLAGVTWGEAKTIQFDFGSGAGEEEDPGTGGGTETGEMPIVGKIYKDCFVLKSEDGGDGSTVFTLMSTLVKTEVVSGLESDQEVLAAAINAAMPDVSISGISGWRLPTRSEVDYLYDNQTSLAETCTSLGYPGLASYGIQGVYYLEDNNTIYRYVFSQDLRMEGGSLYAQLRVFTTLTFKQ